MKNLEYERPQYVKVSFEVIIHAGNARSKAYKAIEFSEKGVLERANELISEAEEELTIAHQTQTKLIQLEARGKEIPFTVLFTHAQDTLMIAMSEIKIAKYLIHLYERLSCIST